MRKLALVFLIFSFILVQCIRLPPQHTVISVVDQRYIDNIEEYLDSCATAYAKIRAHRKLEKVSAYDLRHDKVFDSLRTIYPDSIIFSIAVNDNKPQFRTLLTEIEKIPIILKDSILFYSLDVEYEIDKGGCCDTHICCDRFVFDMKGKIMKVEPAEYISFPTYY